MENVYIQLKEKFAGNADIKEIFTKSSVDIRKSKHDIYREIAFGEMPFSQEKEHIEQC